MENYVRQTVRVVPTKRAAGSSSRGIHQKLNTEACSDQRSESKVARRLQPRMRSGEIRQ